LRVSLKHLQWLQCFGVPAKTLMEKPVELANWNAHKTNALKTQLFYAAINRTKNRSD
jgi:hypothetical protein